jgi:hypothetical protein
MTLPLIILVVVCDLVSLLHDPEIVVEWLRTFAYLEFM